METIKNYLESMFRSLPKTEKVIRAKSELLQMMEDKYSELLAQGVSENEVIGTVISEFGNLDELADELGISDEITVKNNVAQNSRKVSFKEIHDFLNWHRKVLILRGLGIALCICCVVPPILLDSFNMDFFSDILGPVFMFFMIAIGVCLIVFAGNGGQEWNFLRKETCSIDDMTYNYVVELKHNFIKPHSIMTSAAIACYILSCVPAIIFDYFNSDFFENLGGASLFILVASGVFLNVYASTVKRDYNFVLGLNDCKKFSNHSDNDVFDPKISALLSVYWLTVICIYLCWSFLTFNWYITWIIWPIAGVVYFLINAFAKKSD